MMGRWCRMGLAVALCLGAAGCAPPATFVDGPWRDVRVEFRDVAFTLKVPYRLGTGELNLDRNDGTCAREEYVWERIPTGADDDDELLFAGTTTTGCPEHAASNGDFPTWTTPDDLPENATQIDAPVGTAYRFPLNYVQCTNECYSLTYQVVFIDLPEEEGSPEDEGSRSFWLQAANIDPKTRAQMIASIEVT